VTVQVERHDSVGLKFIVFPEGQSHFGVESFKNFIKGDSMSQKQDHSWEIVALHANDALHWFEFNSKIPLRLMNVLSRKRQSRKT